MPQRMFLQWFTQWLLSHLPRKGLLPLEIPAPLRETVEDTQPVCFLLTGKGVPMNAFVPHHQPHIAFTYRCFDRILFNGYVQRLLWAGSLVSFLRDQRQATALTPAYFRGISDDYHRWLQGEAQHAHLPIVEPPPDV